MKPILTFIIACLLISCTSSSYEANKYQSLSREIDSLKARVAVLEIAVEKKSKPSSKSKKATALAIPASTGSGYTSSSYPSSSSTYSGRCNATTKKGTQCKRSARSNGYCWQHGG